MADAILVLYGTTGPALLELAKIFLEMSGFEMPVPKGAYLTAGKGY